MWVEERVLQLLDEDGEAPLFVSGCVRNQSTFYDRFDAVVLLTVTPETILDRMATRGMPNTRYLRLPQEGRRRPLSGWV